MKGDTGREHQRRTARLPAGAEVKEADGRSVLVHTTLILA